MTLTIRSFTAAMALLSAALLTSPAAADSADAPVSLAPAQSAFVATAVDTATLESYRGGSAQVHNDMELTGTTANNTAQHVNTGNNAISAGAFANMNGIPVVIQNSGANVLIQNAVIVHMQMN